MRRVLIGSLAAAVLSVGLAVRADNPPAGFVALFNGKDLTGWKKFTADEKRAKTEFSVTKEGWLHLKSGPGDLQTEGHPKTMQSLLHLSQHLGTIQRQLHPIFRCN